MKVTVSTDDPISFGSSLNEEYAALASQRGFSRSELARLARNGFEVALLDPAQKQAWTAQLDALVAN